MAYVVIDHHHDPDAGVYRLVIGREVTSEVPLEDPDPDGPATETVVVGHEDVRDYVFADSDDRWQGLSDDEIASQQRAAVEQAVTAAADDPAPPPVTALPGVGAPL
jgi:hypothetical protein